MQVKNLLTTILVASATVTVQAQTWYDVSSAYLNNAGFDSDYNYAIGDTGNVEPNDIRKVAGWTLNEGKVGITGVWQWGTKKTYRGYSLPETNSDGTSAGGGLVISPGNTESINFIQYLSLPAGDYLLVAHNWNAATGEKTTLQNFVFGWNGKRYQRLARTTTKTLPSQAWSTDTVAFTLSEAKKIYIQIGQRNNNLSNAELIIDKLTLLRSTDLSDEDVSFKKEILQEAADSARTLLASATGSLAQSLEYNIGRADSILNVESASVVDLQEVLAGVNGTIDNYNFLSTHTVTTDKRYARGATMAFGRMSYSGYSSTEIEKMGFCYAEGKPYPTIEDSLNQSTLSNQGTIYWMKNLKPATLYYMRAYIISNTGDVIYGDPIKFYTIPMGDIQPTIRDISDSAIRERITNAVNDATYWWNNLTEMQGYRPNVGYNSGTPTADCSYGGYVRVGPNTSYQATGTILHEWLHGVGVIPYNTQWSKFDLRAGTQNYSGSTVGSGNWLGDRVSAVLDFWDNTTGSYLHGDYQHMWPYGINGASEDNHSNELYIANGLICQALGEDGLEHTYDHYAEPYYSIDIDESTKYYLKNEDPTRGLNTSFLVDNNGTLTNDEMSATEATANDAAAWYLSFDPATQYYSFRNASTGRYLTNSSGWRTMTATTPTANMKFQLMKARVNATDSTTLRGYWISLHASRNPNTLFVSTAGKVGNAQFNIANSAKSQRWLILTADEAPQFDIATGISTIKADTDNTTATAAKGIYNLQGVKVADDANTSLPAGIYIVNGKKYVVK